MTNRSFYPPMLWALTAALSLAALSGCAREDYYCDATGCYFCDGVGCRRVPAPTRPMCSSNSQCAAGQTCTALGCTASCRNDADCPRGTVCRGAGDGGAGGQCIAPNENPNPACTSNAQCTGGLECVNGMCQRTSSPACGRDTDCAAGNICVGGRCVAQGSTCQFDNQCGAGRVCINNECRAQCDAMRACPTGQVCTAGICRDQTNGCTSDAMCAMGQRCVNGACLQTCTAGTSGSCGSAELYCDDQGLCRPDTRPRPFCTNNSECRDGSQCVAGLCRVPCSPAMADMCARVDATYRNCAPISYLPTNTNTYCITDREFRPLCNRQSDCAAGQSCVNGACQ